MIQRIADPLQLRPGERPGRQVEFPLFDAPPAGEEFGKGVRQRPPLRIDQVECETPVFGLFLLRFIRAEYMRLSRPGQGEDAGPIADFPPAEIEDSLAAQEEDHMIDVVDMLLTLQLFPRRRPVNLHAGEEMPQVVADAVADDSQRRGSFRTFIHEIRTFFHYETMLMML